MGLIIIISFQPRSHFSLVSLPRGLVHQVDTLAGLEGRMCLLPEAPCGAGMAC